MRITQRHLHDRLSLYNAHRNKKNRLELIGGGVPTRWCLYTTAGVEATRWLSTSEMYEVLYTLVHLPNALRTNERAIKDAEERAARTVVA